MTEVCHGLVFLGSNRVRNNEYALEIFDDAHGDTWVRVRTGKTVSQPIPFADFVVGNQ